MRITLSAALTADGFLDDRSPRRLMISTPEDWADVCRLRCDHDAILVGAATLRRDDPALVLRDEEARARRRRAGLRPDIAKVALTRSGDVDPALRFFTVGDADRYIFSPRQLPALEGAAEVVVCNPVTACAVVTELEKRGVGSLFVEGGAAVLRLFLSEGMADTLRLAVNPALRLGAQGCTPFRFDPPAGAALRSRLVGGMQVSEWTLRPDTSDDDRRLLGRAVEESRRCTPSPSSYCVGAVVRTADGRIFTGYTHETSPTDHAEQAAVSKSLASAAELRLESIYSSKEPCSRRASQPESCTAMILRHGFSHVAFALYEPDRFVACRGALTLREAGVDVRCYPDLGADVLAVNAHLW